MNPVGSGSEKTGMYGGGELSDRDIFVAEQLLDKPFVGPMPATQGSDAWLDQREGNITASIAGTLFEKDGVEKAAINLANARLGNTPEFLSSGHVAEGNKYEDKVLAAFLNSKDGQGFEMREAFFETNKKYPGFGVSPDASLYNEAGDRYLVEAKFLSSDQTMAQSKKKYGVQVQQQLMVSEAKGVFFSRMNKRTGRLETELILPDKEVQAEILKRGNEALALSETLDAEGVSDMTKRLSRPARQEAVDVGPATVMQTEAKAKHAKATVMDLSKAAKNPLASAISSTTVSDPTGSTDISAKEFGDRVQREENIAELRSNAIAIGADKVLQDTKDAKDHAKEQRDIQAAGRLEVAAYSEDETRTRKLGLAEVAAKAEDKKRQREFDKNFVGPRQGSNTWAKKEIVGPMQGSSTGYNRFDRTDGEGGADVTRLAKAEMEAYAEVTKAAADATKKSEQSLRNFGASVQKAAGVVSELAGAFKTGNSTQMDNIHIADAMGLNTETGASQVEGLRHLLKTEGAVDLDVSGQVLNRFGDLATNTFAHEGKTAKFITSYNEWQGVAGINNPSIKAMGVAAHGDWAGKKAVDAYAKVQGQLESLDPLGRAAYTKWLQLSPKVVTSVGNVSPEQILNAEGNVSRAEVIKRNSELGTVEEFKRDSLEWFSNLGPEGTGLVVGGASLLAGGLMTATVKAAPALLTQTGRAAAGQAIKGLTSSVANVASKTAPHLARAGAVISGASVAVPATALTGVLASTAIYADAMENDPESVMGKLAIAKSKKGPEMPGILGNREGTAIAESIMDWWNEDSDIVPSTGLGNASTSNKSASTLNSNVVVNVEVSSDLSVATEVNDNGSIYSDLDTSNSQD